MGMLLDTAISLEIQYIFFSSFLPLEVPWYRGNNAHLVSKIEYVFQLFLLVHALSVLEPHRNLVYVEKQNLFVFSIQNCSTMALC